ncbi:hypothetical protein C8J57DRAFT_280276 [Mycena rebaudengoi]|nr:hypothetical protein C8J57DRAFT_280276 [Mycena rebaudengoi]
MGIQGMLVLGLVLSLRRVVGSRTGLRRRVLDVLVHAAGAAPHDLSLISSRSTRSGATTTRSTGSTSSISGTRRSRGGGELFCRRWRGRGRVLRRGLCLHAHDSPAQPSTTPSPPRSQARSFPAPCPSAPRRGRPAVLLTAHRALGKRGGVGAARV